MHVQIHRLVKNQVRHDEEFYFHKVVLFIQLLNAISHILISSFLRQFLRGLIRISFSKSPLKEIKCYTN